MPQFLNSTSKDSSDVSILSEPPSTDLPTYLNSTNLSLTYNTSAHFTIHYTDSGTNVVFNASDRINGVPRYVVELGNLFEYTWTTEVENYGFKGPLDGDITNDLKNRLHVYIRNIDTTLGSTYPFAINTSTGKGLANISHTFIEIENDFDGFVGSREGLMNVTTAHEFFGADLLKLG
ncbi:MAG: hypothetical protein COV98_01525 [Candidatus Altarchaeum sp. CG12_big_fil_rev_8_21_14_0_65_33_22]|nr:MAG: hypothetical protein AUK59_06505 [Candidatus Altarchaeum sp. CG2_30_32_3053]PIN67784.1 MAG: hypothetical protein COV98_01525 [Candidatus Altarchaeum sp. CG12_big_fil_rev_8_21_14_0_65_33_22]PIV28589.1 MAG: hypothetical protein COS36_01710 [Candidatus Altarchaeum sp. CG03_land_8_20_14_0_80_32_618]PIX48789.1 MAG: hypothetical protein COZ53_02910 [Candidatus Altarchaeum sp. CG_4_8_14_3_um_filter_33_2054]PIZ30972.1 MAG: hypothetical protein COY41_03185 [Candidatus Altarchaeum sp. CG_4_10_14_